METPENSRENIKVIFKEIDKSDVSNKWSKYEEEFYNGLKKWFRKTKELSDKQFECLLPFRPEKD